MGQRLFRTVKTIPLAIASPIVTIAILIVLWITDLLWVVFGRRKPLQNVRPNHSSASVVIPNWNGKDLLEQYLPSVVRALSGNPANEVLIVDNGSTDGSAEFVRTHFPEVTLLALERNLGFGGGSNAGIQAARNDIVVLLNSDMRVAPDFLAPLLEGFTDGNVFAVSAQIFFTDPARPRQETGLTQAWWAEGGLRVRHRLDASVDCLFPCFYPGGGSSAFDRRKFLELGGFDPVFHPFYLEDTDLGMLAWKRGWKVLYQPASHVWHEHRGTIGRKFSHEYINNTVRKNFLLFTWKNIHEPLRLASHLGFAWSGAILSALVGDSLERTSAAALFRAFGQLFGVCAARWKARSLAIISDSEAFLRPLGGYFRDRFASSASFEKDQLSVLFVSPYPVCPPVHGGAVFMNQTLRELGQHADVHLVALLDQPSEEPAHEELRPYCQSMEFVLRLEGQAAAPGSMDPFAVREFASKELEWIIHRQLYQKSVDILQLEYTQLAQYAGEFGRIVNSLFEHDIYFQSISSGLRSRQEALWKKVKPSFEYLRALRYELDVVGRSDLVQTCSAENRDYLLSFRPELSGRVNPDLRAGIDVRKYEFNEENRVPKTLLFLGSFRHLPNLEALNWFAGSVFPLIRKEEPDANLIVIGSDPPEPHTLPNAGDHIHLRGFVEDIQQPLRECALFICPILRGSGVRVKLLEAFASGIPSVSTPLGAEGLESNIGEICALGATAQEFAAQTVRLLREPETAKQIARLARGYVEAERDIHKMTLRLVDCYREAGKRKITACRA